MKLICEYLGGSFSYGLNTPDSDQDWRGVFINQNIGTILGLDRYEHQDIKTETEDKFYSELRHYLNSLRKCNSQGLELLFNENWISKTSEWSYIQENKNKLLNTQGMFKCVMGYINSELKLAIGLRSGQIGGKRFSQVQKFGFSPKNFVQLFRLIWASKIFFTNGYFPINVKNEDLIFWEHLMDLKTNPQKYDKNQLEILARKKETELKQVFDHRDKSKDYKFDLDFANKICLELYLPILNKC